VSPETAVQQVVENLKLSSRSEVDRTELFELVSLNSDLYFNSTQVRFNRQGGWLWEGRCSKRTSEGSGTGRQLQTAAMAVSGRQHCAYANSNSSTQVLPPLPIQVLYLMKNLDLGLDQVGCIATIIPQIINYKAALEVRQAHPYHWEKHEFRRNVCTGQTLDLALRWKGFESPLTCAFILCGQITEPFLSLRQRFQVRQPDLCPVH
jgi:hypothetical protein